MRISDCHKPQEPLNQFITTLYQRSVYGRKKKPNNGIIQFANIPLNQLENNHSKKITNRGSINPSKTMIIMMII
jgi:hypothetical protein